MGYKTITEDTALLDGFPGLTQAELDAVDELYPQYLFFEKTKTGRKVWTTCCHVDGEDFDHLTELVTPQHSQIWELRHNDELCCPFCGRPVTVKNRKQMGTRGKWLAEYRPVLFLRASEDGGTVWAQGYWTLRNLLAQPSGVTLYLPTRVYRFKAGEALQWIRTDFVTWRMEREDVRFAKEPFQEDGFYNMAYCAYYVVGMKELERSFLRYTGYQFPLYKEEDDLWRYVGQRKSLVRFLALAALHPQGVEMMMKSGMQEPLRDYVYRRKKNVDAIRWEETDPRKVFGLDGRELKLFLAGDKNLDVLRVRRKLRWEGSRGTYEDAAELVDRLGGKLAAEIAGKAKRHRIQIRRSMRYLEEFAGPRCHGGGVTLEFVAQIWCDYIDSAVRLGYDLTNPVIQMPRDLEGAHDAAAAAVTALMAEKASAMYKERYLTAQKKYGLESEHFLIRAPVNGAEIVAEGQALCHCVAGYAERHTSGVLTILFLRDKQRPGKPLATIEMRGTELIQVHGWKNEREACPENPKQIPARQLYAEILDPWLAWLKAGGKRDKQGRPVMPKKKRARSAA